MSPGGFSSPAERWREIYRLLDCGLSIRAVAGKLGISDRTVNRAVARRRGYTRPPWPRWTAELDAKVRAALEDGWSYREISKTYKVNEHNLSKRYPGHAWSRAQCSEYARMVKELDRICETHSMKISRGLVLAA